LLTANSALGAHSWNQNFDVAGYHIAGLRQAN
jgi:hypothetical protein